MALQVWNGDFRDLWDVMLQKWAPHCHDYYLLCGDVVESNDIKRKYFTWDYMTQIAFSRQTPEEIRKVFEPYADQRFNAESAWGPAKDIWDYALKKWAPHSRYYYYAEEFGVVGGLDE